MRIAIGGISHESSTFAKTPTTLADFQNGFGIYRGDEIVERFCMANTCTGGFLEGADAHGFEAVPLLWAFAYPGGGVERGAYDALLSELLERLAAAGDVDGVLLDLHGAMVIEGIDDGDGHLISAVRQAVAATCPIVATFDLHGNHTVQRVEQADAVVGFDTYPHVDMRERGREAADLMVDILTKRCRPTTSLRRIPLIWSAECQVTAHPPMDAAMAEVHRLERQPGILSITLATGFPWADVPQLGASVIAVSDNDQTLADKTAGELADWVWQRRETWHRPPLTAAEGLTAGEQAGRYPIILADQSDNTGGGAPGDSTEILRTFLDRRLDDALVLYVVDPAAAQQAHEAGRGAHIEVEVGGHSDPLQGPPVQMDAEVVALSDGRFTYDGPMYAGLTGDMGRSAWLRQGGVSVVVVGAREQPLDPAFSRSLGIDCGTMKYIAVKSAVHFRSGFEKLAGSIHNVNARALHSHDFQQVPYRRRPRPLFPLD